ncbi:Tat (twin-arginine translocation) pathway signal sequence [Tangfeifania diversioriginum]|uniref:Tat (Twin-arginine translocation) pathway signal sequence n=1 Tax=Tangfeifania diversioriginum TaxID=1168035 RepID=A0A1M6G2J9_9BACT|nr:sugar phosphate isomerase/epimerase family protein [Tangfeifania diversioriginum]SHJ04201.1 Tat (twin-arginine translocation) pathway signal sequence [Tangfeifania diversioriginum]
MTNRRNFLKAAGIGLAAATMPQLASGASSSTSGSKNKFDFQLGVASYSLRNFSREEALGMTVRCGVDRICFKSMHLSLDSGKAEIEKAVADCKEKGVTLYGGGVIYMNSKAEVDQAFEYAKTAGMELIVGVPQHELLEYVEEKVKSYDIKLAIHNHGPGDDLYPSAESAYNLIKNMDTRMGLCIDIGHTKRIDRDPEQDVKDFFDRVHDIHIKDVTAAKAEGTTCIVGRGVINIPSFLETIVKMGYKGTIALEYEADGNDPLPGMMESFGYTKGVLAML